MERNQEELLGSGNVCFLIRVLVKQVYSVCENLLRFILTSNFLYVYHNFKKVFYKRILLWISS